METPSKRRRRTDGTEEIETCRRSDWTSLPNHLLFLFMIKLNLVDFHSFRGVCSAWRSAAKDSEKLHAASHPPLLLRQFNPPRNALYSIMDGRYLYTRPKKPEGDGADRARRLHDSHTVFGVSCGYLIVSDLCDNSGVFLAHPLTGDILDGVVFPHFSWLFDHTTSMFLTAPPTSPGCVLVALDIFGVYIYYCRPGARRWTDYLLCADRSAEYPRLTLRNIAVLDGRLHVVMNEDLLVIELVPNLTVTRLHTEGLTSPKTSPYLVECGGELVAIQRLGLQKLMVHRFEPSARRWVSVNDLRGHAIAVGDGCCFSWKPPAWGDDVGSRVYLTALAKVYLYDVVLGRLKLRRTLRPPSGPFQWVLPGLCFHDC